MAEISRDHLAVGLDMRGYNLSSRPEGIERLWHAMLFYTAGGSKPRDKWHRRVRVKVHRTKPGVRRSQELNALVRSSCDVRRSGRREDVATDQILCRLGDE